MWSRAAAACFWRLRFYKQYQKALRQVARALLTVLPQAVAFVSRDVIRQFMEMGPKVLAMQTIVPMSFAVHGEALLSIYMQIQASSASQGSASVAKLLLHPATANSFQMVMSGVHSKAARDCWLMGLGREDLTTVIIAAHYDAFRAASWLLHGVDCNRSGISLLLGLTCPFSKLYTNKGTHSVYNLLSFAPGGSSSREPSTDWKTTWTTRITAYSNIVWPLSSDTMGQADSLYLHISKPPCKATLQYAFLLELETVATSSQSYSSPWCTRSARLRTSWPGSMSTLPFSGCLPSPWPTWRATVTPSAAAAWT